MVSSLAARRCTRRAIVLACALSLAPMARAGTGAANVKNLDTLVVTANKIEQDLLDVPASVTVIDAVTLEEMGITTIEDVIREIPGMTTSMGSGSQGLNVNMRGINTSMFTDSNPVVIYIDGIPQSNRFGYDVSLANVERIEVLRGPQGTLYGKDAIGGVINVVNRRPEDHVGGAVAAEYGSDNVRSGTFEVSGAPRPGTLYAGANGRVSGEDGWVTNDWPGMRKDAAPRRTHRFNTYLLYRPSDQFSARLSLNDEKTTSHWMNAMSAPGGTPLADFDRDGAEHTHFDTDTKEVGSSDSQALALEWTLPTFTLTSVTTHKKYRFDSVYDADFGVNPYYHGLTQFNDAITRTLTEELRMSSRARTGLRWVAGLYLEKEKHERGPYGMEFPYLDASTTTYYGDYAMDAQSVTDTRTSALFGQAIWPVAGTLELTVGGRWQRIEKEFDLNTYYLPVGTTGPAMYGLHANKTWTTFLPKAALNWRIGATWSAYVSYAAGYMPGGFNYFASSGGIEDNRFEPQTSKNYEAGVKGRRDTLTLSANVFYMDIEDIHVYKAEGAIYATSNARRAHAQGAEAEIGWRPAGTGLDFGGALGVIQAEYDDYDAGAHVFDGQKVENTPAHTLRLSAAWVHPGGFYARLDLRNQGRVHFYDDAAKTFPASGGYTVLDTHFGYRRGDWEIYGYVRNLGDRAYLTGFVSSASVTLANYGTPRRYGVGLRYRF